MIGTEDFLAPERKFKKASTDKPLEICDHLQRKGCRDTKTQG